MNKNTLIKTASAEIMIKRFENNTLGFLYEQEDSGNKNNTIRGIIEEILNMPVHIQTSEEIFKELSSIGKRRFHTVRCELNKMLERENVSKTEPKILIPNIKSFKTVEEAKKYGKNFGKYQYEMVFVDGKKKILCGTDMVYEEAIWGNVYEIIKTMYDRFTTPEMLEEKDDDECMLVDETSEVRDHIIEWFEKTMDVEFVTVYDEY